MGHGSWVSGSEGVCGVEAGYEHHAIAGLQGKASHWRVAKGREGGGVTFSATVSRLPAMTCRREGS